MVRCILSVYEVTWKYKFTSKKERHLRGSLPVSAFFWNFSLKEVYLIGILDFCFNDSDPQPCLHHVQLTYQSTQQVFYNKLEYFFVEIPKFNKTEIELQTELDCWLFALKHMNHLQKIPVYLNKDGKRPRRRP